MSRVVAAGRAAMVGLLASGSFSGCTTVAPLPSAPTACLDIVRDGAGAVAGFAVSSMRISRGYQLIANDPVLASIRADATVYVRYIDSAWTGVTELPKPLAVHGAANRARDRRPNEDRRDRRP
jgi:hypothetical protein